MLNLYTQLKGSKCLKEIKLNKKKRKREEHDQHKHQTIKHPELFVSFMLVNITTRHRV